MRAKIFVQIDLGEYRKADICSMAELLESLGLANGPFRDTEVWVQVTPLYEDRAIDRYNSYQMRGSDFVIKPVHIKKVRIEFFPTCKRRVRG